MIKSSFLQELDKESANAIRVNRQANRGFKPRNSPTQNYTFAKIEAQTGAKANQVLTFPEDLGSTDQGHFIMFFINEQANANVEFGSSKKISRYSFDEDGGSTRIPISGEVGAIKQNEINEQMGQTTNSVKRAPTVRLTKSIAMYMPAQVSVSQDLQYEDTDIGALAGIINSVGTDFNKTGSFEETYLNLAESKQLQDAAGKALQATLDTVAPGAKAVLEIESGKVISNRMEMVFKGLGKRSFSFQFTLMPKSENEANIAKAIVDNFRFYSAPSFEGDVSSSRTFIVPATFDIEYRINQGIKNSYLNRISTCVLEKVDVSYGGERVAFFRPNAEGAPPVQTSITLNFKELEVITRERIAAGF
tara:strand:- start:395 stop:1480 length:1086 start_codon:yes stop_codon:yes gene_type:complete